MADFDAQPGRAQDPDLSAAQRDADELDLSAGLIGVTSLVAGARALSDLLADIATFAAHAIPRADGVSIVLMEPEPPDAGVRFSSATTGFVDEIDTVQYRQFREGPCIAAAQTGRVTVSGSLGSDDRWPHFGGRVARMGVHSALSLPLTVDDHIIGAINAYAHTRDAFGEHAVELGTRFAAPAAVSVHHARLLADARDRTEALHRALSSRAVIDQAIGIIRSRSGVSQEEAFERLKHLSQVENVKLAVVAEHLLEEAVRRARARNSP
jgi:GAF domain-containing protein